MKKVGLIINPIAGMGGSVGLKGTDHVVEEAIRRGAVPMAESRVRTALEELLPLKESLVFYTFEGAMGGRLTAQMGFSTVLIQEPVSLAAESDPGQSASGITDTPASAASAFMDLTSTAALATGAQDTVFLASKLAEEKVDLILFAGGDGTARDIYRAVELGAVCVGIPAGVKIHSPVYAKSPRAAGKLAEMWLDQRVTRVSEEEVLDIDEEEYRAEKINTKLYGYLKVPREKNLTQNRKAPTPLSETAAIESIAYEVVDSMEEDTCYLIGAGTTTRGIMQMLGLKNTLIGVDLIQNKKLLANDIYGAEILSRIRGKQTKLVVTITGGQGFLFGRGNQQLTPEVIREIGKNNIIILATKTKLADLGGRPLLVDTSDEALNRELCGYYRAITSYGEYTMCQVSDI